jgi:hypothetical protein
MRFIAAAFALALVGCAGPGGPCSRYLAQEECPVGSPGWNAATNAEARAWERCNGYGLKVGSPGYAQCVLAASAEYRADQRRDFNDERQARAAAAPVFVPLAPLPLPPRPVQTTCVRTGDYLNCNSY